MIKSNWIFMSASNFLLWVWSALFILWLLITLWLKISSPASYKELVNGNWTFIDQWIYYFQKTVNSLTSWVHKENKNYTIKSYWIWYIVVEWGKKYYIADVLIKNNDAYNTYMDWLIWKKVYVDWHFKSNDWDKMLSYIYLKDDKDMINGRLITLWIADLSYHQWVSMYYWVYLVDYLKIHEIINSD